jgi:hypothetical protein
MKKVRFILIVAAFLLLNFDSVLGCVCVPTTIPQKIEQAQSVFSGKVIGRTATKIRFKVQKWWKGTPYYETFIYADSKVITSCDISFKNGEIYLVYAFRSAEGG